MNIKRIYLHLVSITLSMIIAVSATLSQAEGSPKSKYTNVVLILIDDISHYGVSAYGSNRISSYQGVFDKVTINTPNIDKLAEEGFIAEHAYSYPLCENTRVALMSAKYNKRNYLRPKSLHESDITFGDVFKKQGYKTGLFGKWKQTRGTRSKPAKEYIYQFGWDEFTAFDVVLESQRFINPRLIVNGEVNDYTKRKDLDPVTGRRWYGPDIVNRDALAFIEKNKNVPFFLYYPMMLIHDEHQPTPDTKPKSIFDTFDETKKYPNGGRGDDRRYLPDMIAYTDKLIGKVIHKLEEQGLRENTLIVIVGDNGTKESFSHIHANGSVYPGRKGGNADNGIHVPLVMNLPSTVPASRGKEMYSGMIHITDIYPTIAEAVGIDIPNKKSIDGISFWPQALGIKDEPRKNIHHWYIGNYQYKNTDKSVVYAFNKNFKRYAPSIDFPKGRFFDLRSDKFERAGDTMREYRFGIKRYSGLDVKKLSKTQKEAYDQLGKILTKNQIVNIKSLKITTTGQRLKVGDTLQMTATMVPENTTRNGLIWESSNPAVLKVNKFGEVLAVSEGNATISVFSWSDAEPFANNTNPEYLRSGVSDSLGFTVSL